jgi:hypothetical protein
MDSGNRSYSLDCPNVTRSACEPMLDRINQSSDRHWFYEYLISVQENRMSRSVHLRERAQQYRARFGIAWRIALITVGPRRTVVKAITSPEGGRDIYP